MEVDAIFCTRMGTAKEHGHKQYITGTAKEHGHKIILQNVCNVIRFRGNQTYRKHVHVDDKQDSFSPSTAIF